MAKKRQLDDLVPPPVASLGYLDPTVKPVPVVFPEGIDNLTISLSPADKTILASIAAAVAGSSVITPVTGDYTTILTTGTELILCDATSGVINISLSTAVGNKATLIIKKIDSSANAVITTGLELIDNDLTQTILFQNTTFAIISNNVKWVRIY